MKILKTIKKYFLLAQTDSLLLPLTNELYLKIGLIFSNYLHTHNNGHPGGDGQTGDSGEAQEGTDRNNFIQLIDRKSKTSLI